MSGFLKNSMGTVSSVGELRSEEGKKKKEREEERGRRADVRDEHVEGEAKR